MKVTVHFKEELEVEIPDSFLIAISKDHFERMVRMHVDQYLRDQSFYVINAGDLEECIKFYKQFKHKL